MAHHPAGAPGTTDRQGSSGHRNTYLTRPTGGLATEIDRIAASHGAPRLGTTLPFMSGVN